jgi:hypothetical protein
MIKTGVRIFHSSIHFLGNEPIDSADPVGEAVELHVDGERDGQRHDPGHRQQQRSYTPAPVRGVPGTDIREIRQPFDAKMRQLLFAGLHSMI